jgi:hypothetical protein
MAKKAAVTRHVVRQDDGRWAVKAPNATIAKARETVKNKGGGEVRIHARDGRIRDSDTIKPGNDPYPPRDRR